MTLPSSAPILANKCFPPKTLPGMTLQRTRLVRLVAARTPPYLPVHFL